MKKQISLIALAVSMIFLMSSASEAKTHSKTHVASHKAKKQSSKRTVASKGKAKPHKVKATKPGKKKHH